MNANPKNLRRGDLITAIGKSKEKTLLNGDRFRVLSVALPFIYVDRWNWHEKKFIPSAWDLNVNDYNIMRINKNAVTPLD